MQSSIDNLAMQLNTSQVDHMSMTTFATLIGIGLFVALVYFFAPAEGEGTYIRLEQFRLAAPLGGIFHDKTSDRENDAVRPPCDCDQGEECTDLSPVA